MSDEVLDVLNKIKGEQPQDAAPPPQADIAPPPSGGGDDEVMKALQDAKQEQPQPAEPQQPAQAAPPPAEPQAEKPVTSWSEVPGAALQHAIPSAIQFGKNIAQPVLHPVETYENIRDLGHGLLQKAGLISGEEHIPQADALGKMLVDRYGSVDAVRNTMATDPVGFAADMSAILTGGGSLAARAPGIIGKAGEVAAAAGKLPGQIAMAPLKGVGKVAAETAGLMSGAGPEAITEAAKAGVEGGAYGKAFLRNWAGLAPTEEIVGDARNALGNIKANAGAKYKADMAKLGADTTVLPFNKIDDAVQKGLDVGWYKNEPPGSKEVMDTQFGIASDIYKWKTQLNPQDYHTAEGLDALKRNISMKYPTTGMAGVVTNGVLDSIRKTITDTVPGYAKYMKAYEQAQNQINELQKTFSLPANERRVAMETSLRKLQSILRNNVSTSYGRRRELAQYLIDNGGKTIMAQLAGQALNPWTGRGLGKLAMTLGIEGAGAFLGLGATGAGMGVLATMPLMSPKLMGAAAYATGFAGRPFRRPFPQLSFQAGRADQTEQDRLDQVRRLYGAGQ